MILASNIEFLSEFFSFYLLVATVNRFLCEKRVNDLKAYYMQHELTV